MQGYYETIIDDSCRIQNLHFRHLSKKLLVSNKQRLNVEFTYSIFLALCITVLATWFYVLILVSGDIHPNPGPVSSLSDSYDSSSSGIGSIFGTSSLSFHLSCVHYNVQSILTNLIYYLLNFLTLTY